MQVAVRMKALKLREVVATVLALLCRIPGTCLTGFHMKHHFIPSAPSPPNFYEDPHENLCLINSIQVPRLNNFFQTDTNSLTVYADLLLQSTMVPATLTYDSLADVVSLLADSRMVSRFSRRDAALQAQDEGLAL